MGKSDKLIVIHLENHAIRHLSMKTGDEDRAIDFVCDFDGILNGLCNTLLLYENCIFRSIVSLCKLRISSTRKEKTKACQWFISILYFLSPHNNQTTRHLKHSGLLLACNF